MREQKGYPNQSPVRLRTNAPRQTEEQATTNRYRQPRTPRVADEGIDDGWTGGKTHTSAVRYDTPPRRETTHLQPAYTKKIPYRRFTLARFLVIFGLLLFFLALGILAFNAISGWWQLHTHVHSLFSACRLDQQEKKLLTTRKRSINRTDRDYAESHTGEMMQHPVQESISILHELDLGRHILLLMSDGSIDLLATEEQTPDLAETGLHLDTDETYRLFISLHEQFKRQ